MLGAENHNIGITVACREERSMSTVVECKTQPVDPQHNVEAKRDSDAQDYADERTPRSHRSVASAGFFDGQSMIGCKYTHKTGPMTASSATWLFQFQDDKISPRPWQMQSEDLESIASHWLAGWEGTRPVVLAAALSNLAGSMVVVRPLDGTGVCTGSRSPRL